MSGGGSSTQLLPVNPYFEIKYNHNLSDKPMSVKGAVNSTDTSFTRTGIESRTDGFVQNWGLQPH